MRTRGVVAWTAGLAVTATLLAVSASSAATMDARSGAPPGAPGLDRMALAVGDLAAGGSIRRQGYVGDRDFVAFYVREFKPGASLGRSLLSGLESDVGAATSPAEATRIVSRIRAVLRSRSGRQAFVSELLQEAGWDQTGVRITFGGVRRLAEGDAAFTAALTLSLRGRLRLAVIVELVRVDRAVQVLYLLSAPNSKLIQDEATRLVGLVAARMRAGLIPISIGPPTISGTAQAGETLSASAGSWSNVPTTFAFQWLRCDAAGSGCAPIDGAVAMDDTVAAADVGSTLEVSVVATNAVGSSVAAVSAPTLVVVASIP
jgi:hypothetical protein